ncbi:sigma-70 family RNA polymerase sigma factor [Acetobacterium bakii]|uniref:RNA polymerase sigma 70 n=1 Tax=Acetobacterium bakii TaxID=52689 RepID=A0A0L6U0M4_9FIRM|nr:sigma-70 family RNA polymerase sigma factor [Acetobacterium bakii]KNZ41340.1 RNA polymerase sigma 70 [Acetobacterium bakii]
MRYESTISKKDAMALFANYKSTQDKEIRDKLFENYMYIPKVLSRKYGRNNGDDEDIFQVACLGLLYAVERYDATRGYQFDTFATPTIVGEIKHYYRDYDFLIRIPRSVQELNRKVNQARAKLEQQLMRSPLISEIAGYLDISEERIIESIESSNAYYPKSLSMEYDNGIDDNALTLMDLLGKPDDNLENVENIDFLKKKFKRLNVIEKFIFEQRYFHERTQKEVAFMIRKSQMTVSRIEKIFMEKITKEFKCD